MAHVPVYEALGLSKTFRSRSGREVTALKEVSCTIPAGTLTLLRGASGSGKSTLLSLLGGLDRPTRGEVRFVGQSLTEASDAELARIRRRMGFLFQDPILMPRLPIWENVTYGLIPEGHSSSERYRLARTLLEKLGIELPPETYPEELSGGEKQQVALSRALASGPEAILADEPTSNLDPKASDRILSYLREIARQGRTVILVSHDRSLQVEPDCTYDLRDGSLVRV